MTPFGIRKRIKAMLLGSGSKSAPPSRPQRPKFPVTLVLPNGEEFEVEAKDGDSLVLASGRGAYPISTGCADGTCSTCQVEILEGFESLTSPDEHENATKVANGLDPEDLSSRLGCQTAVIGAGVKARIVNVLGEELFEG